MNTIPKHSTKLLCKFKNLESFDIKVSDVRYLKILDDMNLIESHKNLSINELMKDPNSFNFFTITTEGHVYLETLRVSKRQFLIPNVLSSIAILLSIIALYLSYLALR